jgi:Protein of unknown function (DUF2934)
MNAARTPNPWPTPTGSLQESIRLRAEEIYIRNGKIPGHDLENWAQAEREVLRETAQPARRHAIVVRVKGTQYVGEYTPSSAGDYQPGEFTPNAPVPVIFQGEKMFVKRPNGKILETTLVPGDRTDLV